MHVIYCIISVKYVYERGNFLGELIGAVGGALMIALIVVLAFRFVWETFSSGSSETLKSISYYPVFHWRRELFFCSAVRLYIILYMKKHLCLTLRRYGIILLQVHF